MKEISLSFIALFGCTTYEVDGGEPPIKPVGTIVVECAVPSPSERPDYCPDVRVTGDDAGSASIVVRRVLGIKKAMPVLPSPAKMWTATQWLKGERYEGVIALQILPDDFSGEGTFITSLESYDGLRVARMAVLVARPNNNAAIAPDGYDPNWSLHWIGNPNWFNGQGGSPDGYLVPLRGSGLWTVVALARDATIVDGGLGRDGQGGDAGAQ